MLNPEQRKQIIEKWSKKEGPVSVASIADVDLRENMALMLENQETEGGLVTEAGSNAANTTNALAALGSLDGSANNDAYKFKPIALALVRRTFPELFANKVVGVQAMNGPVGLAYAMRVIYNDGNKNEAGWENVDYYGGYTGSQSYTSAILSQEQSGIFDTSGTGATTSAAEEWQIASSSGTFPDLKMFIDQKTITATSRKLAASFSLESAQDLKAMHGIEIEREMINYLQYEIVAELDRELVYRMKKAAVDTANGGNIIAAINVSGTALDGRWSAEKYANITTSIIHQANQIAIATRRGAGNFAIVSPTVATALQAMGHPFIQNNAKVNATQIGVSEIGTLNGTITIYRDSYARGDFALVGYKGPTTSDAGLIFCPYLTALTNRAIDPQTFSPRIGVLQRYGLTDTLLGAGRYYRLLSFTNMSTIVIGA